MKSKNYKQKMTNILFLFVTKSPLLFQEFKKKKKEIRPAPTF